MTTPLHAASGSTAEDLFIELFSDTFGAEKAGYLYSQYHFYDIYNNDRFADFMIENGAKRIAIEIDDEASHNPRLVSDNKFYDDLLKQNSMIHLGWDVYRWAVRQMQLQPDTIKDELRVFLGSSPHFREVTDYLPCQRSKAIEADNLELKEHQKEALNALEEMRGRHETIALIYHATGTGKTVTAVTDAKRIGKRTLFIAHTNELVTQAAETFRALWSEVSTGIYMGVQKEKDAFVVCGSVQSIALHTEEFSETAFDYLIIDEAHHASAETYQKILAHFKPSFTLGLTATPERADDQNILDIFKNTAHKLDIKTAVEIGELVSVRCIRIHTNIDLTKVRFNSVRYNIRDLESKIFVPDRNNLIVDTFMEYVSDKRTVIFCASVKHAEEIASKIRERGVPAQAVSGGMKQSDRLFMARPTMSKVLYTQQLGRGMRLSEGKEFLMVFDFVDNASQYNMPYSLHRLMKLKDYHPGKRVLGTRQQMQADEELYRKGEKPEALIDYPVSATDYEAVDVFNWQDEAAGMLSQMEFIRRVDVQSETVERYIRDGRIIEENTTKELIASPREDYTRVLLEAAKTESRNAEPAESAGEFGWTLINDDNRKELFMDMVRQMDMSYSYKPVLLKAIFTNADKDGRVSIETIVAYFKDYYEDRKARGLTPEKPNSIFAKGGYTDTEARRNILSNPFKRFEDMQMLHHTKTLGIIEIEPTVWKHLTDDEKAEILRICDEKLEKYFERISGEKN